MKFELTNNFKEKLKVQIENQNIEFIRKSFHEVSYADIAELLYEFNSNESKYVLDNIDLETSSKIISELDDDTRENFLKIYSSKEIADVLKVIDSDDGTDILLDLSADKREDVLVNIDDKEKSKNLKVSPGRILVDNFMPSSEEKRLKYARALDGGEKFISVQHGSGYGTTLFDCWSAEFEYPFHAFFTWGWKTHGNLRGNFFPLPSPFLGRVKNKHKERNNTIVMAGTKIDLRDSRLIGPRPIQWLKYRESKKDFINSLDLCNVLLPISTSFETPGTFINAEGRAQSFNAVIKPLEETRPGWKVLRVLANLLKLNDFDYESSEEIKREVLDIQDSKNFDLSNLLNNFTSEKIEMEPETVEYISRIGEVPIYFSDPIVRRADSLQRTIDASIPKASVSTNVAEKFSLSENDIVKVTQGNCSIKINCKIEKNLPSNVIRLPSAHISTKDLGDMFGKILIEKL